MINATVGNREVKANVATNNPKVNNSNVKLVKGDTGATFTPHVDEFSNLSWTNDSDLPNPPTRNIRGRDGDATVTPLTNLEIERILEG